MIKKKIFKNLILFFLIITIIQINNFFYNFYYISKNDLEKRMVRTYGFCDGPSYGYISYIYKKFNLKKNILILNGEYPSKTESDWFMFRLKNKITTNHIILINSNDHVKKEKFEKYEIEFKNKIYKNLVLLDKKQKCYYFINDRNF